MSMRAGVSAGRLAGRSVSIAAITLLLAAPVALAQQANEVAAPAAVSSSIAITQAQEGQRAPDSTILKTGPTADTTHPSAPAIVPVSATVNWQPSATVEHATSPTDVASKAKAAIESLLPMTAAQRAKFARGAAEFPEFCHDWEHRLHMREVDNLDHLRWQAKDGYQTATYIGYSPVESCVTKPTRTTLIGKLTYEELDYYIVGKTIDEAKHSKPKVVGKTNTLEIFSWDKNKWFY